MVNWNEVTWYTRLGAYVLFLGVVPSLAFYIGMKYEAKYHSNVTGEYITNSELNNFLESRVKVERVYKALFPEENRQIKESAPSTTHMVAVKTIKFLTPYFSEEDALRTAQNFDLISPTSSIGPDRIGIVWDVKAEFRNGSSTGRGGAWFIAGEAASGSSSKCPERSGGFSNLVSFTFEMNAITGDTYIETVCSPVIY